MFVGHLGVGLALSSAVLVLLGLWADPAPVSAPAGAAVAG
jgi:hypothetical protein